MTDTTLAQRLEIALAEWDSYDPFASNDKAMAQAMAVIDASRALLPEIARLTAANKALEAENERLRAVVSNVCEALPNGAFCAPQCSIEFMEEVPKEVAIVCSDLSAKLAKVEAERDALKHDIARHIQIASDEATLADGLVASKARLSAELAEARKREDRLQEFAKWAIREGAFQAADLDGLSIQEKAHELGLIEATTYNSEKHGPSDCAEDGDEWFVFSQALSPAQPDAKEVDRHD